MAYKAQQFIEAIPGTGGVISAIADRIGCQWHTVRNAIERFPTVKAAYDDEREKVTDLAESVLIKSIEQKNLGSAKWWLTRKGGERGFVEKWDVTSGGEPLRRSDLVIIVDDNDDTTESGPEGFLEEPEED